MNLEDILQDKDFGHHMRLQKGAIADFYRPSDKHEITIAERRHWLDSDPQTYMALLPEGAELLSETLLLASEIGTYSSPISNKDHLELCKSLGCQWEADFLLMKPDNNGVFRLVGGCLCFPSHWAIQDKLGCTMAEIHSPVPGLNDTIGNQIDTFLQRIKPGTSWQRVNWGLARTPELNLHPSRRSPRLDASVKLEDVWWRLEEQSLVSLPMAGGILFGIKVTTQPLSLIKNHAPACQGMIRTLQTMPDAMTTYKGLASAKERLIQLLHQS